jgi:hypothetical protein
VSHATRTQSGQAPTSASRDDFYTGVAQSFNDLIGAFRLVYHQYVEAGYCAPRTDRNRQFRLSPYALLPDVATLVARPREARAGALPDARVVATMTMMVDHPQFGLPMDALFPDELAKLRERGRRLMEVGLLADRRELMAERLGSLLSFFKILYDHSRFVSDTHDVVITVNPHHAPFYRRYFGFEQIGEPRNYAYVENNPAVLLRLDMVAGHPDQVRTRRLREMLLGAPLPLEIVKPSYRPEGRDLRELLAGCEECDGPAEAIRRLACFSVCSGIPMADLVERPT